VTCLRGTLDRESILHHVQGEKPRRPGGGGGYVSITRTNSKIPRPAQKKNKRKPSKTQKTKTPPHDYPTGNRKTTPKRGQGGERGGPVPHPERKDQTHGGHVQLKTETREGEEKTAAGLRRGGGQRDFQGGEKSRKRRPKHEKKNRERPAPRLRTVARTSEHASKNKVRVEGEEKRGKKKLRGCNPCLKSLTVQGGLAGSIVHLGSKVQAVTSRI